MTVREKEILGKTVEVLSRYLSPKRIYLFGSRARARHAQNADFDIAADCRRPSVKIQRLIEDELSGALGLYSIDLIYLGSVDKDFRERAVKTGRLIYGG